MMKWTQDEARIAEYLRLYQADVTHQKIAEALGITRNASVSYAARKNLPNRGLRMNPADRKPYKRPSRAKPKVSLSLSNATTLIPVNMPETVSTAASAPPNTVTSVLTGTIATS